MSYLHEDLMETLRLVLNPGTPGFDVDAESDIMWPDFSITVSYYCNILQGKVI